MANMDGLSTCSCCLIYQHHRHHSLEDWCVDVFRFVLIPMISKQICSLYFRIVFSLSQCTRGRWWTTTVLITVVMFPLPWNWCASGNHRNPSLTSLHFGRFRCVELMSWIWNVDSCPGFVCSLVLMTGAPNRYTGYLFSFAGMVHDVFALWNCLSPLTLAWTVIPWGWRYSVWQELSCLCLCCHSMGCLLLCRDRLSHNALDQQKKWVQCGLLGFFACRL